MQPLSQTGYVSAKALEIENIIGSLDLRALVAAIVKHRFFMARMTLWACIRRTANGNWRRGGNKDVAISHVKEALEVGKELCVLALSESPYSA